MRPKEPSVQSWISRILDSFAKDAGPKFERLVVLTGPTVRTLKPLVVLKPTAESTVEQTVADIDSAVRSSGHKAARVDAYRVGERVPELTRVWEVVIPDVDDTADDAPQNDTPVSALAGLLRQAHAHNDSMMASVRGLQTETLHHYREQYQSMRDEIKALRKENNELWKMLSTRDDERLARAQILERDKAIAGSFTNIVTALATRLAGGGQPVSKYLIDLMNSLTDKQGAALLGILDDNQKILLESIWKTVDEVKNGATK